MNSYALRFLVCSPVAFLRLCLLLVCASIAPPLAATQSDVDKEQRWAEQVVDGLLDGDAIGLDDGNGHEFLGILTEGDGGGERAVILLHGIGVHPNWPDVIYPLREGLLEHGTTSLSIQLPILANEADPADYVALFAEVPARIDAAIEHLADAGYRSVVLVAHSMGASMASHYLARGAHDAIDSVVLIGMGPGIDGNANVDALARVSLPLLDLYGSNDLPAVLESTDRRAAAGLAGAGAGYRQVTVKGANHFFQGHEQALRRQVIDWLERQPD